MIMGMSGHFFTRAETLGTMRLRDATMRYVANPVRVSRSGQPLQPYEGRVAIVVDEMSASTTEILAAALQRLGRARVFGSPSAGQALPALLTEAPQRRSTDVRHRRFLRAGRVAHRGRRRHSR